MTTLLTGVNAVLKKNVIIDSSGALASLTDSPRQVFIDTAIAAWNEVIDELYSLSELPKPKQLAENTITLVTNDRDYALQSNVIQVFFPFQDETNGRYIYEYPGGYLQLVHDQPFPANETGLPQYGAISPEDGELYLDKKPTSAENGLVYKYRYNKDLIMDEAADVFPFNDMVYRALVDCVSEKWKLEHKREFDSSLFNRSLGRACRMLSQTPASPSWAPVQYSYSNPTDPYAA